MDGGFGNKTDLQRTVGRASVVLAGRSVGADQKTREGIPLHGFLCLWRPTLRV
jgi:hypothetical protein